MSRNRALVFAPAALLVMNAGLMEIHAAQVDSFLKLDGIAGETTIKGQEGAIEVESFSWGISNATIGSSTTGAGAGKVTFHDLTITKTLDKTTPTLLLKCASGQHFKTASLTIVAKSTDQKVAGETLLKLDLEDVTISSLVENGAAGLPTDVMSLNFSRASVSRKAGGVTIAPAPIDVIDVGDVTGQ